MKPLKLSFLSDKCHHGLACFALLYIAFYNPFAYVLVFLYIIKLKSPWLRAFFSIVCLVFVAHMHTLETKTSSYAAGSVSTTITIEHVTYKNEEQRITAHMNNEKVLIRLIKPIEVLPGDVFFMEGVLVLPTYQTKPYDFDYALYLKRQGIFYTVTNPNLTFIKTTPHIGKVREVIHSRFLSYPGSSGKYLSTLLLGQKDLDETMRSHLSALGISHLFAISGLHIALIALYIKHFLTLFFSEKTSSTMLSCFLIAYIAITGFLPSVFRAGGVMVLNHAFKRLNLHFTSLDLISIVAMIMLLIDPFSIYHVGFQLSFMVSIAYVLYASMIASKHYLLNLLKLTLLAQATTLPIVLSISTNINLLSLIINPFLICFFTTLFLPFTFITALSIKFAYLYNALIASFENWVYVFIRLDVFTVSLPTLHAYQVIIYYLFLGVVLVTVEVKRVTSKGLAIAGFFMFLFVLPFVWRPFQRVVIFDVNQGSSALIASKNNGCVALIDHFSNVYEILPKMGIKRIDALFISHGHFDHYGELGKLLEHVNVNNVYVNAHETNVYLLDILKSQHVTYVGAGASISCDTLVFDILNPGEKSVDTNNNSLVIKTEINGLSWLFPGDIEAEAEQRLDPFMLASDVLVLPHHGSKSSSSMAFLKAVNPRFVVASAGRNNKFGFVHAEIKERLIALNLTLFSTQEYGTMEFEYRFNQWQITSYPPTSERKKKWRFDVFMCII